jgi:protoporphyrinogen oxidase
VAEGKRIVIVGGGITGLSAAHAALSRAREKGLAVSVTLLERSPRYGGNVLTERVDGFVLDAGPDSTPTTGATSSPGATTCIPFPKASCSACPRRWGPS